MAKTTPKIQSDSRDARRSTARLIDPASLMRIKSLEMRARVVVEGFYHGIHRSPYHGFSVEFSEYRQYSPGDDPRYVDWRVFARSDRYYIKRFEDETNLRCHLLVDQSRSMGFGSLAYTKGEYARTLAATLAYFLWLQRDAAGLLTFDERIVDYIPPRYRPGHMHRLMLSLERHFSGSATDLAAPIEKIARVVSRRGLIVLISDLLAPIDTLGTQLGYLRSRGHEVVVLRVLDPAEADFGFESPAIFRDLESGRDVYVDPEAARQEYEKRFGEHALEIETTCRSLGIDFFSISTGRPLELALLDYLGARTRRGRRVLRRRQARNTRGGKA